MTPISKKMLTRRVKDITLGTTLGLALLNGSAFLQSCGNNNDDRYSDAGETSERYKKGVRTFITETAPGTFKITDEQEVGPERAGAIVNYFDGRRDTLSVAEAQALVKTDPSTSHYYNNPSSYERHHSNGLANALLWGGLGYMLGRQFMGNSAMNNRYSQGMYANPSVYARSADLGRSVSRSRIVTSRPSGGRGGFFGRGRSGGFSS